MYEEVGGVSFWLLVGSALLGACPPKGTGGAKRSWGGGGRGGRGGRSALRGGSLFLVVKGGRWVELSTLDRTSITSCVSLCDCTAVVACSVAGGVLEESFSTTCPLMTIRPDSSGALPRERDVDSTKDWASTEGGATCSEGSATLPTAMGAWSIGNETLLEGSDEDWTPIDSFCEMC